MGHWEVIAPAQLAIVNVRYNPGGLTQEPLNGLNVQISEAIKANGTAMVGTTQLNGVTTIRLCTINPRLKESDLLHTAKLLDQEATNIHR